SLAIEEQFYWCWPVVMVLVLDLRRRARIHVVAGMTALAAVAAPLIAWRWGGDAAYWSTPARLSEILAGATLAFVLDRRRSHRLRLPARVAWCAPLGLVALVVVAVTWPATGGPAERGGLALVAIASAALILGLQVDGPVRRMLANPALVSLGVISYGVYLYHWPVYAVLDEQRTGWHGWWLFAIRVAVTIVLAVGSYVFVEQPIRDHRWSVRGAVAGAAAASVAVAVAAWLLPIERPGYWTGSESARQEVAIEAEVSPPSLVVLDPLPATSTPATDPPVTDSRAIDAPGTETDQTAATVAHDTSSVSIDPPDAEPTRAVYGAGAEVPELPANLSRPARILVIGDSTASAVGEGLVRFAAAHPSTAQVTILWSPACGFVRSGTEAAGDAAQWRSRCDELRAAVPETLADLSPDVVLLMQTVADTATRTFEEARAPLGVEDPDFDEFLAVEYESQLFDLVAAGASKVAWVIPPPQLHPVTGEPLDALAQPAIRRAVDTVARRHPDLVTVIDVDAWQQTRAASLRPDGLHYSPNGAALLAESLVGPVLVGLAVN
ncbi:MAG: acyltransferase family protein, partial [Desertimonas sp.]